LPPAASSRRFPQRAGSNAIILPRVLKPSLLLHLHDVAEPLSLMQLLSLYLSALVNGATDILLFLHQHGILHRSQRLPTSLLAHMVNRLPAIAAPPPAAAAASAAAGSPETQTPSASSAAAAAAVPPPPHIGTISLAMFLLGGAQVLQWLRVQCAGNHGMFWLWKDQGSRTIDVYDMEEIGEFIQHEMRRKQHRGNPSEVE
jgi:hypothetical protein